jgi:hypothetical protein
MKTVLFMFSMFCATGALAQTGSGVAVLNGDVQRFDMISHPSRANISALAQEQSLISSSTPTIERGERPLWELGTIKEEMSLGEAARLQRQQHANDKKAPVVWHN